MTSPFVSASIFNSLVLLLVTRQIWISLARVGLDHANHSTDIRLRSGYRSPGDKILARPRSAAGICGMCVEQHGCTILQKWGESATLCGSGRSRSGRVGSGRLMVRQGKRNLNKAMQLRTVRDVQFVWYLNTYLKLTSSRKRLGVQKLWLKFQTRKWKAGFYRKCQVGQWNIYLLPWSTQCSFTCVAIGLQTLHITYL